MTAFISDLRSRVPGLVMRERVGMSDYTTFRIGGPADLMVEPQTPEQLEIVWKLTKEHGIPVYILGGGSNMLVADEGLRGAVIRLTGLSGVTAADGTVKAQCGAKLSKLAAVACGAELAGLEFSAGIPGTAGGAVFMNAGAYGGEMSGVVTRTVYLGKDGEYRELNGDEHQFGYRASFFAANPGNLIVETELKLADGNQADIKDKMDELAEKRRAKQPMSKSSAGSVFKRPEGHYAGALVEQCGLKGVFVGGAMVSEKHAGFIVNIGGATCADVLKLIELIQKTVLTKTGILLEPEIKVVK